MAEYEIPSLNQLFAAHGMFAAMAWPAWLVTLVVGIWAALNERRRIATWLIGLAGSPFIFVIALIALLELQVDVGPIDGPAVIFADITMWMMLTITAVGILSVVALAAVVAMSHAKRALRGAS